MGFSTKQIRALRREIDDRKIRTRQVNGRELSYIEGWHAIAEANRIFGHDGWSRETVEARCILNREVRGNFTAVYAAKVRISVFADGRTITREGHGTGEGHGASPGETHDIALKAAETDATKRALATFGKPFGLSLYLADRKGTGGHERRALPSPRYRAGSATDVSLPARRAETATAPVSETVDGAAASEAPICGPALLEALQTPQSVLPHGYPRRVRDRQHLKFVSNQLCLKCARWPSDAHHLTYAQPRAMGMKVSDEFVVPLCRLHHREVHHARNELAWWKDLKIDPIEVARKLWEQSHSKATGLELLEHKPEFNSSDQAFPEKLNASIPEPPTGTDG
jgi:Rad52/22 family double-strand break repair protein